MDHHALRRALLAGAAVAALATACTGQNPGGFGTIIGHVTKGPTCPGPQRPGQVCTAPVTGVAITTEGRPVATATTDATGTYRFRFIAMGPVTLHVDIAGAGVMSCESPTVTPRAGATVRQDIDCDTGIR